MVINKKYFLFVCQASNTVDLKVLKNFLALEKDMVSFLDFIEVNSL
jgi:hypothetical protein